jgi:isoleucyl-tRNA synthetase
MMVRVEDVFDCWFESGSMPYGQAHYPFENKEWFESHFPADFIVEYSAQTRGWFYTLMVLSTALFDRPPFLNCICHGVILDSTGQKLSKRLNNYADPLELFDKYGADALRVTMLSSNVVRGQELLIDKDGKMVFDSLRLFIKPIWNAYHFFCLYANLDGVKAKYDISSGSILDRYILSKLKIAVGRIENSMDQFDTVEAYAAITDFFEVLNNWYIRRSRSRFWKTEQDADKLSAYNTLYTCLEVMMKAMSSLLPLISENIYRSLTGGLSVHLEGFPNVDSIKIEENLVKAMDQVLDICNAALFIRSEENIRIRQPLSKLLIHLDGIDEGTYNNYIAQQFEDLIKDEVNVKSIIYQENVQEYADLKLSINFPLLGKRRPEKMKEIIVASKAGNWAISAGQLFVSGIVLLPEEYTLVMEPKKGIKGVKALSNSIGLVKLDLEITKELEEEGIARDLVRFIQQARKDAGFEVSDRIKLNIKSDPNLEPVLANYGPFITDQTLSEIRKDFKPEYTANIDLNNQIVSIEVAKLR